MLRLLLSASLALVITNNHSNAQEVGISAETSSVSVEVAGKLLTIERIQDTTHKLTNEFTKTSRPCPPFCIAPIKASPGVETVGELEVIDFLEKSVATGKGLLIDARLPEWFAKGTIPGAVNVPFATLNASNPYRDQILTALGGTKSGSAWDFTAARELTLFCNGPWCEQSRHAITDLVEVGYPEDKLHYYRGGMQNWLLLGLTVETPNA